jgi:hypothetical protein
MRQCVGALIWLCSQTRPDLCFDVSWLGSSVTEPTKEHFSVAQKVIRRAQATADLCIVYRKVTNQWSDQVIVTFSDAGWATRTSGHSQGANIIALSSPEAAKGKTAIANMIDYGSSKITLTVKSSYDAELHAGNDAALASESLQASVSELSTWLYNDCWSVTDWLRQPPSSRIPFLMVIDAKGLWTKIKAEHKTEKRSTIYIRSLMEVLARTGALVYWVNSGHMLCDALTKRSDKNPAPNLDLLHYFLTSGQIRITYCEDSWRRELYKRSEAGTTRLMQLPDPSQWNSPGDTEYDTIANILA